MSSERSAAESLQLLETTLELGDELDYLLIECASEHVRHSLKNALGSYAVQNGRSFKAPGTGSPILAWLEGERITATREATFRERRPIYFVPIAADEEGFVLARLNENRDNLIRNMRGALCLVGTPGFLDRLPALAPSIWSFRTKTFCFNQPPSNAAVVADRRWEETEVLYEPSVIGPTATPSKYDCYISASYRDEAAAIDLMMRLTADGIRCLFIKESDQDRQAGLADLAEQARSARFVLPLLSPDYADSIAWRAIENSREMIDEPDVLRGRTFPIMVRDCIPPPFFLNFRLLDFRSETSKSSAYARLRSAIQQNNGSRSMNAEDLHDRSAAELNISFLTRGAEYAKSVVRLSVSYSNGQNYVASGVLITEDLLLTAHSVLINSALEPVVHVQALGGYELGDNGRAEKVVIVDGDVGTVQGDESANWATIRLMRRTDSTAPPIAPFAGHVAPVRIGNRVSLIHHPRGGMKKVSFWGDVRYVGVRDFEYTPHLSSPGSSGAPVFNERWEMVGLHSAWVASKSQEMEMRCEAIRIEPILEGLRKRGLLP